MSDGLLGDVGHILKRSSVGAEIDAEVAIKLLANYQESTRAEGQFDIHSPEQAAALRYVLSGGDDYELVFTAPSVHRAAVAQAGARSRTPVTRIGRVTAGSAVRVLTRDGRQVQGQWAGFDHFKT